MHACPCALSSHAVADQALSRILPAVWPADRRKDGLAQQVLSALAKLKVGADPVLAMAASCTLLALAQEDAHPAYMASTAAAVLADQLLQVG